MQRVVVVNARGQGADVVERGYGAGSEVFPEAEDQERCFVTEFFFFGLVGRLVAHRHLGVERRDVALLGAVHLVYGDPLDRGQVAGLQTPYRTVLHFEETVFAGNFQNIGPVGRGGVAVIRVLSESEKGNGIV